MDTLRADRLGCYGYGRETSPHLDAFAEGALVFENAIAESSWTLPSHFTMLSGLHPLTHGADHPLRRPGRESPMLAEVLGEAGWSTFAITGGGWLEPDMGFGRGFRTYETDVASFGEALERARDYIEFLDGREPYFAFLHTYDVHCPYDPRPPWRDAFRTPGRIELDTAGKCGNPDYNTMDLAPAAVATLSDRYDGGVREMDEALGAFLEFLEESGELERTVVIVTSDHGEELGEHGRIGHEGTLHAEVLRIPLLVRAPGVEPGRSAALVGLADVVPTALALLGVEAPPLDGVTLPGVLATNPPRPGARLSTLDWNGHMRSVWDDAYHLVEDLDEDRAVLYRWPADPLEREPLRGEALRELRALGAARSEELRAGARPVIEETALSAGLRAELRALGYGSD